MKITRTFDTDELDRLTDLLSTYRDDVLSGNVSGYGQTKEEELEEINYLLAKLTYVRGGVVITE